MEEIIILHCSECDNPLNITSGRGSYCIHCGFAPSMQDTYFKRINTVDEMVEDRIKELEEKSKLYALEANKLRERQNIALKAKKELEELRQQMKRTRIESTEEILDKINKVYK